MLQHDGYGEGEVASTLRRLRSERYLDDAAYAFRFARSRLAHQGLGRHRIRAALGARGVARATVERELSQALSEVSETELLERLARRYWTERKGDEPRCRLRKLWAFLLRRGFPAALAHERLRALWPRFEDALEGLEATEPEAREE